MTEFWLQHWFVNSVFLDEEVQLIPWHGQRAAGQALSLTRIDFLKLQIVAGFHGVLQVAKSFSRKPIFREPVLDKLTLTTQGG